MSSKVGKPDSYRIEVWTNFDESDLETIMHFQNIFTSLFKEVNFELKEQMLFKQMKGEGAPKLETAKSLDIAQEK